MLILTLIALSGGQIPPIDSTITTPPDNQTALFCVLNNAGQEVCFSEYCQAYPADCTSVSVPTFLLKANQLQRDRDVAERSCIMAVDAEGKPYWDCMTIPDNGTSALLPDVQHVALNPTLNAV